MKDDLFALYAYNRWADDHVVRACRHLVPAQYVQEPAPGWSSLRASLVHLAGASHAWARRLRGETVTALATEAELPTLDHAAWLLAEAHDAFDQFLPTLTPERLASIWSYRNLAGQERRLPLWSVLRHVVNHATYHRGQVASKLRRFGVDPPITDLAYWAIEQTPQ